MKHVPVLSVRKRTRRVAACGGFVGRFETDVTKDDKVSLPAEFRAKLGSNELYVLPDPEEAKGLRLVPVSVYDNEARRLQGNDDIGERCRSAYEQAVKVAIDVRGRIRIPPKLLPCVCSEMNRKVVLRGRITTISIISSSEATKATYNVQDMLAAFRS